MPKTPYRLMSVWLVILVLSSFLFGYQVATAAPRAIASPEIPLWLRGTLQYLRFESRGNPTGISQKDLSVLYEVFDGIESEYIDADEIKTSDVVYGAASGAVKALGDPYSSFLPPVPAEEMRGDIEGHYYGVGISIEERGGHVIIVNVFPESPADKAGLLPGDIISSVDGENTIEAGSLRVVELVRGPANTTVDIGVLREGEDEELVYTVSREDIKYPSVWEHKLLDGDIGYVLVSQFTKETPADLMAAINELEAEGAKAFILDLRNNAGGPLTSAIYVSDIFVPDGDIVYLEDKAGNLYPDPDVKDKDGGYALNLPLIVMINQYSASASEIVAGAVQDYGVGTVMGQKSFGKGVVQNVIKLNDGSSLIITTNKYLTPKKRDINEVGIEPDVPISLEPEDIEDEYIVGLLEDMDRLGEEIQARNQELRDYLSEHDFQLDIARDYLLDELDGE